MRRRETPLRRVNPSGTIRWQARWTDKTGQFRYGWKDRGIKGTHPTRREAQAAIDAAYDLEDGASANIKSVGGYFEGNGRGTSWLDLHPRGRVTNATNKCRITATLDLIVGGKRLRDWEFDQLRRRHANELVGHLLAAGRSREGTKSVMRSLHAMAEDAIDDDVCVVNPFRGVKVRATDPRVQKGPRPIRVLSWREMHDFAWTCTLAEGDGLEEYRRRVAEPMVRVLSDCGLRIGEVLPLYVSDLDLREGTLEVRWTFSLGEVLPGTKTDHGAQDAGRVVPVPPELCGLLARMLEGRPPVIVPASMMDRSREVVREALLFPSPEGRLWRNYQQWRRVVWDPGLRLAGSDARPHEFRHSQVTLLRAAGIDPADLAAATGHSVQTATARYTHALNRSFGAIREAVGE